MAHLSLCSVHCSTWWNVPPGCCRETLQQAGGDVCYLDDASGFDVVAGIYERPGFCPIGREEHFPAVSWLVCWPLPPVRCDSSPVAFCQGRVKYRPPATRCCAKMHHTVSLSVQEIWAHVVLYLPACWVLQHLKPTLPAHTEQWQLHPN